MSLLDKLELEDLDEDQRQLAECIGLEAYKNLLLNYAGSSIYVRMPDQLTANIRNEEIRQKFTGYNFHDLAKEFNLSDVTIRRIVAPILAAAKAAPLPGQISLFDDETKI